MSETRPASASPHDVAGFIAKWSSAAPSERANSQLFPAELCDPPSTSCISTAHHARDIAKRFLCTKPADMQEILETLVALGKVREGKGTFSA